MHSVCVVSAYRVTKFNLQLTDASCKQPILFYFLPEQIKLIQLLTDSDADAATWSTVEVCVAIVCACLPTLRPLFRRKPSTSAPSSKDYHQKHTADGSIDVRRGYSVRWSRGTEMGALGSNRDQTFAPATWTDCEGGVKGASSTIQVKEVRA